MRIVAINGSYRGDRGHTRFLLDKIVEGVTAAGGQAEVVSLARLKVNRCLGCGVCQEPDSKGRCVHADKDDVASVFEKMAMADVVLYATPVYVFSMSALLKTLLERMYGIGDSSALCVTQSGLLFHQVDPKTCRKPFATLVCCDNLEEASPSNVLHYFRTYSRFMDAPYVASLVRNGGKLAGHGQDPKKLDQFPRLREVYDAYVTAGRELATSGRVSAEVQNRANQEIIPVPGFSVLKRMRFFKPAMLQRAAELGFGLHRDPSPPDT